jgi:hypothetical protein
MRRFAAGAVLITAVWTGAFHVADPVVSRLDIPLLDEEQAATPR